MANQKNRDSDASLSDQHTFQGQAKPKMDDLDTRSLGDQATFAGGRGIANPKSLGDQATFGGASGDDDYLDDDMEVVDLETRYKIAKTLGKGGMGEVLLATDTRLDRKVAIKRILGDAARSRTAVNRFLTEAKSIAALNHPNVVQIYDYGRAKDGPFLIMEFVDGSSLLDRCREGAIPLEEAIDLVCQLCDGLGRAHAAGIIHRDIKPANVLLTTDGIPKLTDFGLAKAESADTGMTMAGAVLGTLDFMPPEQRRDAALTDARSDLWSLAATLYQMVTGKSPKIIKFNDVPKGLQDVLGKALEDSKESRYQNAKEFREALLASKLASSQGEVELEQGACPSCGTKNPTNRKFCRKCSASLEVACLSCNSKMPMWEEVCDNCGTKQDDLLEKRRQKMAADQAEAEGQLKSHEFENATGLAIALRDEPDLRLQHLKRWAESFLPEIEAARTKELAHTDALMSEAWKHQQAHDYSAALRTLEQVPKSLEEAPLASHRQTVRQLQKQLEGILAEIKRLDQMIRTRVSKRDLNGLLKEVETLQKLQPDRKDLQQLHSQLLEREAKLRETRDEALPAAKHHLQSFDYESCLKELARIDESLITTEIRKLQEQATTSRDRLLSLRQTITARVKNKQLHGLLAEVEECLTLQPAAPDMLKLRDQLQEREAKNAATIAEMMQNASTLRDQCQFQEAAAVLERIPAELGTNDSAYLLAECQRWAFDRQTALQALQSAMKSENYAQGLSSAGSYAQQIRSLGLRDAVFEQHYQACTKAFQAKKEADEAAERTQKMISRIVTAAAALFAISLVVGTGLWVRSAWRASSIASAIREQRWDDALAMDSQNISALLGRAEQRLVLATPDVSGAFTDLELAEKSDASASGLSATKAKAQATRAKVYADQGKIADAELDLQQATNGKAPEQLLVPARQAVLQGLIKQAEAAAKAGDAQLAAASTTKALSYDANAVIPVSVLESAAGEAVKTFEQSDTDTNREAAFISINKLASAFSNSPKVNLYRERIYERSAAKTIKSFEQNDTDANRDLALEAIGKISAINPNSPSVALYRKSVGTVLLARSKKGAGNDLTASVKDFLDSRDYGIPVSDLNEWKVTLTSKIIEQSVQSLQRNESEDAIVGYSLLNRVDPQASKSFIAAIERLPHSFFANLSPEILTQLPPEVIYQIPPSKNSIGMQLKLLPSGTFTMGEGNFAHSVTLTRPFSIGVYEVTQEQYQRVTGINPSRVKGASNPVEKVSWEDAVEFCRKLSDLPEERKLGRVYRLPTEAEWEYACRARTTTKFNFGDDESKLDDFGWFNENSERETHPVGEKKPNAWGLHDMHGNVWEWCADWYGEYPNGASTDPVGPVKGSSRVGRGGSWRYEVANCRSADRDAINPSSRANGSGFRVALSYATQQDNSALASSIPGGNSSDSNSMPPPGYGGGPPGRIAPPKQSGTNDRNNTTMERTNSIGITNSIGMPFILVPSGTFIMGEGSEAHEVTLTKPFYMGIYEVTQQHYERVIGNNPSNFKGATNPVDGVSWADAMEFCKRLSEIPDEKKAGRSYQLPTEAQWEYACRAGSKTRFFFGDNDASLSEYGWFRNNSNLATHPVGEKKPNSWGLYDMYGNVFEWCLESYSDYPSDAVTDPIGPANGSFRIGRGGGWNFDAADCVSAKRCKGKPEFKYDARGFRIVLIVSESKR